MSITKKKSKPKKIHFNLELEIDQELLKKFKMLCELTDQTIEERVKTMIESEVFSAEITNF
jgi:hypothetical protein